jgi:hypothetical protein
MRYVKDSLVINPERDIPLLRQVRNSRFVSHGQLFEFMEYGAVDHCRSSFNWRTRRLVGSGLLSVCDGKFGTGSAVYRVTRLGLATLEHHGHFTTALHSSTEHLPHPSVVFHALELNSIHLALARNHLLAGWHSEVEIASFNSISRSPYQKDYDAVVDVWVGEKKACFALEYERSLKNSNRYQRVRQALECEQRVNCVLYLTSGIEVLMHLLHVFESLNVTMAFADSRDFIRLLLDTAVITNRTGERIRFVELLQ